MQNPAGWRTVCEDSRERRFPRTRQACQDLEMYENSAEEEEAWLDCPMEKEPTHQHGLWETCEKMGHGTQMKNNVISKVVYNSPDPTTLARTVWCRAHGLELHGNQSASQRSHTVATTASFRSVVVQGTYTLASAQT